MSLSEKQVATVAADPGLLAQVEGAIVKFAIARIAASATGAELLFADAIVRTPSAYAKRFAEVALSLNAAVLTSTNGTTLDTPPSDAVMDTTIGAEWPGQVSAGV